MAIPNSPTAFHREIDRGHPRDLAEAETPVEPQGGSLVVERGDGGDRFDVAPAHPTVVQRHQVRAVGIDAAQVGFDEVVGDDDRLFAGHAERAEQSFQLRAEYRFADDRDHAVRGPLPSPSP